jgi:hypothetical protein
VCDIPQTTCFLLTLRRTKSLKKQTREEERKRKTSYLTAGQFLIENKYEAAFQAFSKLGQYKDSEKFAKQAKKKWDDEEKLKEWAAEEERKREEERTREEERKRNASYLAAGQLLAENKYEAAFKAFSKLGQYKDSEKFAKQAKKKWDDEKELERKKQEYLRAKQLLDARSYAEAYAAFLDLGSYQDSSQYINRITDEHWAVILGKTGRLGLYEWYVLAVEKDRSLLITTGVIEQKCFSQKTAAKWETSRIRKWLNADFLTSFSREEREGIRNTVNYNKYENRNTDDLVFLLSDKDVESYFKNEKSRIAKYDNAESWWWLRTKGSGTGSDKVMRIGELGGIHKSGIKASDLGGVRPALWLNNHINLKSLLAQGDQDRSQRYQEAIRLMSTSKFEAASQAFCRLGQYRDSYQKQIECDNRARKEQEKHEEAQRIRNQEEERVRKARAKEEKQRCEKERERKEQEEKKRAREEQERRELNRQIQQEIDTLSKSLWKPGGLLIGFSILLAFDFIYYALTSPDKIIGDPSGIAAIGVAVIIAVYWLVRITDRQSKKQKIARLQSQLTPKK